MKPRRVIAATADRPSAAHVRTPPPPSRPTIAPGPQQTTELSQRSLPTSSSSSSSASALQLLTEELRVMLQLITGRHRQRVYRHHVFFQDALYVFRAVSSAVSKRDLPAQNSSPCSGQLSRLQQLTIRLGESAANEIRANRIDTLPLSLAFLGAAARLHAVLSAVTDAIAPLPSTLPNTTTMTPLRRLLSSVKVPCVGQPAGHLSVDDETSGGGSIHNKRKRPRQEARMSSTAAVVRGGDPAVDPKTIGGVLDALLLR